MARYANPGRKGQKLTKRLAVRVSEAEHEALTAKASAAGMSVSEYARVCIVEQRPEVIDRGAVRAVLRELGAIGNNLNQIARARHLERVGGRGTDPAAENEQLRGIRNALNEILKKC